MGKRHATHARTQARRADGGNETDETKRRDVSRVDGRASSSPTWTRRVVPIAWFLFHARFQVEQPPTRGRETCARACATSVASVRNVLPSQPWVPLLPLPRRIHNWVYPSPEPPSNSQLSLPLAGAIVAFTTVLCSPLRIRKVWFRSRWVRTRRGSLSSLSTPSNRTRTASLSTPPTARRPSSTPPVPLFPCSRVKPAPIGSDSCVWRRGSPRTCLARRWDVPTCVRSEPCRSTT